MVPLLPKEPGEPSPWSTHGLRTANIISDLLAEAGIVRVTDVVNPHTGRKVKATQLFAEWTW